MGMNEPGLLIPIIAIGGGLFVGLVAIVGCTIQGMVKAKRFEESRREIAAYVAEGSISPADAEKLLHEQKTC